MSSRHGRHDTFRGSVISPRRLHFCAPEEVGNLVFLLWEAYGLTLVSVLRIGDVVPNTPIRFACIWIRGPMCDLPIWHYLTCLCGKVYFCSVLSSV